MKIVRTLMSWLHSEPHHSRDKRKNRHNGREAKSLHTIIALGQITLAQIGGNSPAKVAKRLREQGYLRPFNSAGGERWETNPKTGCDYKVYLWTGKLPAEWVKTPAYTGRERRKKARGGDR